MFSIDFPEIVIIFGVALVVLGPKKLPGAAAQIGRWVGRARSMARQFREQLEQEVNSVETSLDIKKAMESSTSEPPGAGSDPAEVPTSASAAAESSASPTATEPTPALEEDPQADLFAPGSGWLHDPRLESSYPMPESAPEQLETPPRVGASIGEGPGDPAGASGARYARDAHHSAAEPAAASHQPAGHHEPATRHETSPSDEPAARREPAAPAHGSAEAEPAHATAEHGGR